MSLELYLDLISPPCRAIYIFAKMNNIHFNYFAVNLLQGGVGAAGSLADWLLVQRKYPHHLLPCCPTFFFASFLLGRSASPVQPFSPPGPQGLYVFLKGPSPDPQEGRTTLVTLGKSLHLVSTNTQLFCNHFLKDKPFLVGNVISLADLMAAVELMQPSGADFDIFLGRPKLHEWLLRVEEIVGHRLFQEAHEKLLTIRNWDVSILDPSVRKKILIMIEKMTK
uniref:Glutathione transferase n=1 Tax=Vombatus ursinus TaxID=29139 RepID=A0A4X2L9P1_VOMUR